MSGYEAAEGGLRCHVLCVCELMEFAIAVEDEELILSGPHFAAWALFTDGYELSRYAIQR
jgi:hypothetical protein